MRIFLCWSAEILIQSPEGLLDIRSTSFCLCCNCCLSMWILNGKQSCSSCSTSHGLLAMGKVDQLHPDLAVDPLGILRPLSKLTHQLPLVQLGYHGSYQLVSFFSPSWLWLWTEDLLVHRSVHTRLLRGWLVLVMIWITSEGGWTPRQMSHCSQIAQGISLVPSITYFTQVSA